MTSVQKSVNGLSVHRGAFWFAGCSSSVAVGPVPQLTQKHCWSRLLLLHGFHIPSQRKFLSVLKSAWIYRPDNSGHLQPSRGLWSWGSQQPASSCCAGLCQPYFLPIHFKKSNPYHLSICHIFHYSPFSLFLQSFSDQGNVLPKHQRGHQWHGFWPLWENQVDSMGKGEHEEILK